MIDLKPCTKIVKFLAFIAWAIITYYGLWNAKWESGKQVYYNHVCFVLKFE